MPKKRQSKKLAKMERKMMFGKRKSARTGRRRDKLARKQRK